VPQISKIRLLTSSTDELLDWRDEGGHTDENLERLLKKNILEQDVSLVGDTEGFPPGDSSCSNPSNSGCYELSLERHAMNHDAKFKVNTALIYIGEGAQATCILKNFPGRSSRVTDAGGIHPLY
jgi:hypothetical protein